MMGRVFLMLAAACGLTGVGLGAFAAHGLRGVLASEMLTVFQTGVLYQLLHALALLGVGVLASNWQTLLIRLAGAFFFAGILLFSGSLYLMTLSSMKLGLVTPVGGGCFLVGWICLGLAAWREPHSEP